MTDKKKRSRCRKKSSRVKRSRNKMTPFHSCAMHWMKIMNKFGIIRQIICQRNIRHNSLQTNKKLNGLLLTTSKIYTHNILFTTQLFEALKMYDHLQLPTQIIHWILFICKLYPSAWSHHVVLYGWRMQRLLSRYAIWLCFLDLLPSALRIWDTCIFHILSVFA